jgi:hypothetical protein
VDPSGVLSSNSHSGVSLQLDGVQTDIEVPFFQNNEFSEFRFNGFFYRDSSIPTGEEGILFNGNSPASGDWPATIYIISTDLNTVTAGISTTDGTFFITSTAAVGLTNVTISRFFICALRKHNCLPLQSLRFVRLKSRTCSC